VVATGTVTAGVVTVGVATVAVTTGVVTDTVGSATEGGPERRRQAVCKRHARDGAAGEHEQSKQVRSPSRSALVLVTESPRVRSDFEHHHLHRFWSV